MRGRGETQTLLSNFPIPEPIIGALAVGLGLRHLAPPARLPGARALRRTGAALIATGGALIAWATAQTRGMRIDEPDRLLTQGPYALSRNPMYAGWLGIASGLGLVLNSAWLLLTTALAFLYLHRVEIPKEEAALATSFGDRYRQYRARVPRY